MKVNLTKEGEKLGKIFQKLVANTNCNLFVNIKRRHLHKIILFAKSQ